MRADSDLEAREKLRRTLSKLMDIDAGQLNRVKVVHGDLAEERLGLSDTAWQSLGIQTNVLIHCGAEVSVFSQTVMSHTNG